MYLYYTNIFTLYKELGTNIGSVIYLMRILKNPKKESFLGSGKQVFLQPANTLCLGPSNTLCSGHRKQSIRMFRKFRMNFWEPQKILISSKSVKNRWFLTPTKNLWFFVA